MPDYSTAIVNQATTFYTLAEEAFRFLEEQCGYRLASTSIRHPEDLRDAMAEVFYVGERIAVLVSWYFAGAAITVGFIELHEPWVLPTCWNALGTDPSAPRAIGLFTLAEKFGHMQDPDFLLGNTNDTRGSRITARSRLIERDIASILMGLARATQRYASDILTGDVSSFPEVIRYYRQKRGMG